MRELSNDVKVGVTCARGVPAKIHTMHLLQQCPLTHGLSATAVLHVMGHLDQDTGTGTPGMSVE